MATPKSKIELLSVQLRHIAEIDRQLADCERELAETGSIARLEHLQSATTHDYAAAAHQEMAMRAELRGE